LQTIEVDNERIRTNTKYKERIYTVVDNADYHRRSQDFHCGGGALTGIVRVKRWEKEVLPV